MIPAGSTVSVWGVRLPVMALPRRFIVALSGFCALLIGSVYVLVLLPPSSHDQYARESKVFDRFHRATSKLPYVWGTPAHKPPVGAPDGTCGDGILCTLDWQWLRPFASSITKDEQRSILPPTKKRTPVYTYYDRDTTKDQKLLDAENELLRGWRRAWWAQGFRPSVLSRREAELNGLYVLLKSLEIESSLRDEIMRWLAWQYMGDGILADYLLLPMGSYDDSLLRFLRNGDFPHLRRYENLNNGLFSGNKDVVHDTLRELLNKPDLKSAKSLIEAVSKSSFTVDPQHEGVAFYEDAIVQAKYKSMATASEGYLQVLPRLINAHLHTTFQNAHRKGIAVLKPLPDNSTALIEPSQNVARLLTRCPDSPLPSSCPPNVEKCIPCVSAPRLEITTPEMFRNDSALYTIGVVPHPYTIASLNAPDTQIDTRYIRRETQRDSWIRAATKEFMGTGVGTAPRILRFKDAVASEHGSAHSLWMTPESPVPDDLDWHFGFKLPEGNEETVESDSPVPHPAKEKSLKNGGKPPVDQRQLLKERALIGNSKLVLESEMPSQVRLRSSIQAWNLADTEVWRFAKAWTGRKRAERLKWEKEEQDFAGSN